ncbi:2-dehydro-3-deoxygalactonokinase [Sporolituus thermophilus]|uniref:2-keto-3-deoxygalactonate kinase n=1 Tax=Sporolituus thermophilus DSM 23256 TaxID=1123285 RepID=A0A1G7P7X7_9FIRM|nr:2-dehydro-3-deoxygalactonokinase [Sporolituus thermophilus]SDF82331.1 2-keto-3-deoxygalactonate kinase [Sporolituus thermophilus DSM 23256]
MYIATIDTGTTNTRIKVWHDGTVCGQAAAAVGVRDTVLTGSRVKLEQGVRACLEAALAEAGISREKLGLVLASGMITANVGLCEVPHVPAPAGVREVARGMVSAVIPEVLDGPIWFVPGVKNAVGKVSLETCEEMDMMRGEEVETIGIMAQLGLTGPALVALPGSHSKYISIDETGRITGCLTTLAGELLDVITHHTLLADALGGAFADAINPAMLRQGAAYARAVGLSRLCFTTRILHLFTDLSRNDKANFLLGAVLAADLVALRGSRAIKIGPEIPVWVAGKPELRQALTLLFGDDPHFRGRVCEVDDAVLQNAAGVGAIAVARARGLV